MSVVALGGHPIFFLVQLFLPLFSMLSYRLHRTFVVRECSISHASIIDMIGKSLTIFKIEFMCSFWLASLEMCIYATCGAHLEVLFNLYRQLVTLNYLCSLRRS